MDDNDFAQSTIEIADPISDAVEKATEKLCRARGLSPRVLCTALLIALAKATVRHRVRGTEAELAEKTAATIHALVTDMLEAEAGTLESTH